MRTAPTQARTSRSNVQRLEAWRSFLADHGHLSDRFRDRYAIVLAQLEPAAPAEAIEAAQTVAVRDPHRAVEVLAGSADQPVARRSAVPLAVEGDAGMVRLIRRLLSDVCHIEDFMITQPPLTQTAVPIHPSRQARVLHSELPVPHDLVALVWSAESVEDRQQNAALLASILPAPHEPGALRFRVQTEYALVRSEDSADPWVFAPNLGETLEDLLRSGRLSSNTRRRIVNALVELRNAMLASGLIWQGFAPRNMFLHDDEIILIDFEEVLHAGTSPARAAECLLWHRIFFADSLTPTEAEKLFAPADITPVIPEDHRLPADSFERALLSVDTVTWQQRRELLHQSLRLEGQHRRPEQSRDRGVLYGHELGHFWGDFLPVAEETRLFAHLSPVEDPTMLVACLEAFEAAMEADICRAIRTSCIKNSGKASAMRTSGIIDTLDSVGVTALAAARRNTSGWYEQLQTDPARLVDELLFQLGTHVDGMNQPLLDTYLVGNAEARRGHERNLVDTVYVGLDFLHSAEPDQPFLHYAEPNALRKSIAQPLPIEGTGFADVLNEINDVVAPYSIRQGHSRYLAFPDSGNALAALAGNLLSPLLNQNLIAVDRSAPSATFVEAQVIEWLRELVGYPTAELTDLRGVKDVSGLWTTGGHLSNHIAMLAALGHAFPDARKHGLRALDTQPAVVMAGPIAHYSHGDAAFHLGLGWDSVLSVDAEEGYTTDPEAVDRLLSNPPAGRTPFMVVGVAGNCRTTALDDLEALGEVCRRHGVWFHVDACHGGSLIFNERLRHQHLAGIEQADSISLDPHKGLFTPYPSSYVLFREREVLTQFSRHTSTVMEDDCWDLGLITPFLGSRGFQSLPTWMLLRHVGTRALGGMVEARQALVRYLERRLEETGLFVRLNDVDFYRMAFVFCPPAAQGALTGLEADGRKRAAKIISAYTSRVNTALYQSGEACFDEHSLADLGDRVGAGPGVGYTIMAACPGNPLVTRADLDIAVERLVAEAQPLVEPMLDEIRGQSAHPSHSPRLSGPAGWSDGE